MSQVLVPVPGSSQLGQPSFLNLIGTVKPYSPSPISSDHKGRGIVIRSTCLSSNSESDVQTGDRRWLAGEIVTDGGPCLVCPVEHSPCDVCYKFHHFYQCPYLYRGVPKGASFNPRYELVCSCGNIFNEAKWTCTLCFGSHPVLKRKDCSICGAMEEHSSHECQVDKARSDGYKRSLALHYEGSGKPWTGSSASCDRKSLLERKAKGRAAADKDKGTKFTAEDIMQTID